MTLRAFALAAMLAGASFPVFAQAPANTPPKAPNIVFIFSDDHAYQAISAYGSRVNRTPNIDRLAKEGARFSNSFVTNSLCVPSRAAILTGKFAHLTGVRTLAEAIKPGEVTFARLLQKAGYATAIVGKWHLKTNPEGFDHWEVLPGQGAYYNPELLTAKGPVKETGYTTDIITAKAVDWIKKRDPNRPFLALVHHKSPHRSWEPGPEELKLYAKTVFPVPRSFFDDYAGRASPARQHMMGIAEHMRLAQDLKATTPEEAAGAVARLNDEQRKRWNTIYEPRNRVFFKKKLEGKALALWKYQEYMRDYLRCVAGVDKGVGHVLAALDEAGVAKDTIVIYGSDQGFYLGEHGWFDKRWMYEESFRTPLLVRWPGVAGAGVVIDEFVQNLDYAQTILEMAGVAAPADMQGQSLVPLLRGAKPKTWRRSLYYHYYAPDSHNVAVHYGVRTWRYKLIHFPATSEWEMFDLEKDPNELRSVHDDPSYAFEVAALKDELSRLRRQYKVPEGE